MSESEPDKAQLEVRFLFSPDCKRTLSQVIGEVDRWLADARRLKLGPLPELQVLAPTHLREELFRHAAAKWLKEDVAIVGGPVAFMTRRFVTTGTQMCVFCSIECDAREGNDIRLAANA